VVSVLYIKDYVKNERAAAAFCFVPEDEEGKPKAAMLAQ
jgi:hypothetical protein